MPGTVGRLAHRERHPVLGELLARRRARRPGGHPRVGAPKVAEGRLQHLECHHRGQVDPIPVVHRSRGAKKSRLEFRAVEYTQLSCHILAFAHLLFSELSLVLSTKHFNLSS